MSLLRSWLASLPGYLWTGWGGRVWTPEEMVADWAAEKRDYVRGVFPNADRALTPGLYPRVRDPLGAAHRAPLPPARHAPPWRQAP